MHYYLFNIGDYQSHTAHLSEIEDLAYRRMLDWCYLHEKPLPIESSEIARQIRMRTHSESIAVVLQEYFELNEDGWVSLRVIAEILKVGVKSEKASASAKARWGKKSNKNNNLADNANALRTLSESNATHYTLPITQNPLPKEKKIATVVACPSEMDESIWEDWMAIRKKKKAPLTETAWKMFINEVESAGWTIDKAIKECCLRNWQSFKAEWVEKKTTNFAQVKADVAKVTVVDSADYEATKRREAAEDLIPKHGPSLETLAKMAAIRAKARA